MDRMTQQHQWTNDIDLTQELGYKHIYQRLAEYENTGVTPIEATELVKAKADGRFVVMPCKIGETIYSIGDGELKVGKLTAFIHAGILRFVIDGDYGVQHNAARFGNTDFFDRQQAQKALADFKLQRQTNAKQKGLVEV